MTDKEILATIHRWMNQSIQRGEDESFKAQRMVDCKDFIEQEWQKQDEQECVDQYNRNREVKDHVTDVSEIQYKMPDGYSVDQGGALDVREIERHRGLVIGEDGTVEGFSDQYSTIGLENMSDTTFSKNWYKKKD